MVSYFDDYVRRQGLRLKLGINVLRVDHEDSRWTLTTDRETHTAAALVIATGNYHTPVTPPWPGMDGFEGELLHAADYRNAWRFAGRDVPVLDRAEALVSRLWFGDLTAHGVPAPQQGIYTALLDDGKIPTLGDELVPKIKDGRVEIVAVVESFDADGVNLADGTTIRPDAVIAATGYRRGLEPMVGHLGLLDDEGAPMSNGMPSAAVGLWFAGDAEPLIGPLQSFRLQASPVARDIAGFLAGRHQTSP
ncbi:MAG: NAD(P)-binding domain-containing protein [Mycobacterium sp.]